jgi:large repetitive protein
LEENFDRFNFAIHKEKEMADFRRWIFALAVLALFAGLASAQTNGSGGGTLTCSANTSNTPTLRQEGITEQIGDIVITCTGGNEVDGAPAPQVNITVALTSQVTTRLVNTNAVSQAILMIDEPTTQSATGAPVTGYGSNAPFVACPNPNPFGANSGGCEAWGYHVVGNGAPPNIYTIAYGAPPPANPVTGPVNPAPNVYQGVVNGSQVTFFGVPIVAPGTNGARVYRITNIRTNASTFSAGAAVQAFIQTSNPSALPISNAQPIVGFVTKSLAATVGPPGGFAQCVTTTLGLASSLTVSEANNFASAFKTRTDPTVTAQNMTPGPTAGQGSALVQDVPGTIYNSESGFMPATGGVQTAGLIGTAIGLADFGTRYQAVFTNLPAGAKVYVTQFSVNISFGVVTPALPGQAYAEMVASPSAAAGSYVTSTLNLSPGIPLVEIDTPGSTTATAAWESITNSPTSIDSYTFGVFISYTANPGANSPALGTASVNLGYAPTSTVITATANDPIPRFLDTSVATPIFSIAACQTVLLFPFLTNLAGFDTGVAISNTSTDPFGTVPQAGTCKLNWYGIGAPAQTVTPVVATATTYANDVSTLAPAFQGYMIAQCAFQYAHGFAFITDVGARNLAMGYLALIIPDPSLDFGARPPIPFPNRPGNTGEQLGQ